MLDAMKQRTLVRAFAVVGLAALVLGALLPAFSAFAFPW